MRVVACLSIDPSPINILNISLAGVVIVFIAIKRIAILDILNHGIQLFSTASRPTSAFGLR